MTTTSTTFADLKLTDLQPHEKNVRASLGNVTDLAASIKAQGILQPLVVAPAATGKGKYTIIAGHRRHAAAKKAGIKTVPCWIREDLVGEADQTVTMLTENLQRADLNAVEEGDAYQTLLGFDLDVKAIAARTGRSQKTIRERVKLAKAPADIRDKLVSHQVSIDEALTLQQYADYPKIYDTLAGYVGTHNWKWATENAKRDRARADAGSTLVAALVAEGVRVMDADERETYRLEQARAVGVDLLWAKLPGEPDDKTGPAVCASYTLPSHGAAENGLSWHALVTEDDADGETEDGSAPAAAPASIAEAREKAKAKAAAAAEEERRAKLGEDLATAAVVRRDHLRDVLQEGSDDIAKELLIGMVSTQLDETDTPVLELVVDMLSLPAVLDDTENRGDLLADHIRGAAQTMKAAKLVILLRYLEQLDVELDLDNVGKWLPGQAEWSMRAANAWRHELGGPLGYEWSDVEAGLLDDLARAETAADGE
ncbi:ParB/RepB/Spo0J family partition protein [Prescottella equi]|uniref:ParB/RepB/Spo0J family partition protein n=1 Tax=Rhodococcus hoagii TaxID=43767 RepID=UPI0007CD51D6|nr:ParB/RepB/Spo0J family partition protein [Prescottella equi]